MQRRRRGASGAAGKGEGPQESALATAVRLLSYASRTEQELYAALLRRGYDEGDAAGALAHVKRLGYVDDAETARRWAESAAEDGRWGVAGIARRLANRGIDADLADSSARQAYDEAGSAEYDVALQLARARLDGIDVDSEDREGRERHMRRLAGFLTRRGFGVETVARVLKQLF